MYIIILILSFIFGNAEKNSLFQYYSHNRTEVGLILDRESDRTTTSIAATGFGLYAAALHSSCQQKQLQQTILEFNRTLDTIESKTPAKSQGWLFHFMDEKGNPKNYSEVSTIDTVLFWASVQKGAELLKDDKLTKRVAAGIANINLAFMMKDGRFRHGLYWNGDTAEPINCFWDTNSEGIILYRFFNLPFKPDAVTYDLPLFCYYYPMLFYRDEATVNELRKAIGWQEENRGQIGVTACDGENGYSAHDENLISPLALWGISRYDERVRKRLDDLGWRQRSQGSINVKTGWRSHDRIGIDVLTTYILLEGK